MSKKPLTRAELFEQAFERNLRAELDPDAAICPRCGMRPVTHVRGAWGLGICAVCYRRAETAAYRAATEELAAERERTAARKARVDLLKSKERGETV